MSDIDQMSLFDMYGDDDGAGFLMSSEDEVMSEEEYIKSKKASKEKETVSEADATSEPNVKSNEEVSGNYEVATAAPSKVAEQSKNAVPSKVAEPVRKTSANKGIPMKVKKPFATFNEGDTLGLISYINDNSGIIRTILATESGAIISMMYSNSDEFKEAFGE